ncbi:hypothetical protein MKW98_012814 [Papaver atlanticum]|uniref:PGG domain-containing protein n=1 Tax=Papaver atlanticum TaxID=357466 RepID=A0AAD4SM44_9MAGN|nr:hypothetical protein MKW98_012814 [Papaver atlanticum]
MEKLHEVSLKGDVKSLRKIFNQDRHLRLDDARLTSFLRTPLHIAAMLGHIKFARAVLDINKNLTIVRDSQGLTPLHLASAAGETEMVKLLVKENMDACTIQDQDGRTPMHLAAMKDEVSILKVLIEGRPEAVHLRTDRNETVLHYCVKNSSFEALKFLVEYQIGAQPFFFPRLGAEPTDRNVMSVNSRDDGGNTILHIAAETRNMEIMKYLVGNKHIKVEINALNNNSDKAVDMLSQTERNDMEFGVSGSYGSAKVNQKKTEVSIKDDREWLKERVNALMVVATLIAGIAFQGAMNPPGGVWQEDYKVEFGTDPMTFAYYLGAIYNYSGFSLKIYNQLYNETTIKKDIFLNHVINELSWGNVPYSDDVMLKPSNESEYISSYNDIGGSYVYLMHYAGTPILASKYPSHYMTYMNSNIVAFLISLSIIVMVICGFVNDTSRTQVRLLALLMCISIGCIITGYLTVLFDLRPDFFKDYHAGSTIMIYFAVWCVFAIIFFLWTLIRNIFTALRKRPIGVIQFLKLVFNADARDVLKGITFVFVLFIILFSINIS